MIRESHSTPKVTPGRGKNTGLIHLLWHLHPSKVPLAALDLKRTWGLGGACLTLILLLACSGSLMLLVYIPRPEAAYASVQRLETAYMFGKFIRSIHYFSASLLVIFSWAHMLRVALTQCFHGPRRFNWIIGLGTGSLILLACFTGYLLPWDQTAYWAVTICLSMFDYLPFPLELAVTGDTLRLFYALHTTLIPVCFLVLLPFHFWKIRKAKGIGLPETDGDRGGRIFVPVLPDLVLREGAAALVLTALVMLLAALFQAPLDGLATPGLSPNPAKAPWYFSGFQELLLHFHPAVALWIVPLALGLFFCLIPYLPYPDSAPSNWFVNQRGRTSALLSFMAGVLIAAALVLSGEFAPVTAGRGIAGLAVVMLMPVSVFLLKKRFQLNLNLIVQSVLVQIVAVYITLALTTILFRGQGMALKGIGIP